MECTLILWLLYILVGTGIATALAIEKDDPPSSLVDFIIILMLVFIWPFPVVFIGMRVLEQKLQRET